MVKNFVLDTNIILHDSNCIFNFKNNNVIIPIVVLEEIDKFKKGNDLKNFHAREFTRKLDEISSGKLFENGVSLGKGKGVIRIIAGGDNSPVIRSYFFEDTPDHRILALAYNLSHQDKLPNVILVTKDINLRMKARSIGIKSEDYTTDTIKNISELYKGKQKIEDKKEKLVARFYDNGNRIDEINADEFLIPKNKLYPNEYFILKSKDRSLLLRYDPVNSKLHRIEKRTAYGIIPRNSEQLFAMDALLNDEIQIVTLAGKAGTGKTLLALACAIEAKSNYKQIYLARPVIPLSNKDMGYLPGDINSKLDPYMKPLWDNLQVIKHQFPDGDPKLKKLIDLIETKKLVIEPLAYIRGRSLDNIFFIVDEAQNLTPHEIKTIITRVGANTKIVFTGDPYQIDTPYLDSKSNGLTYLIDKFKGQQLYAHITLEKGERSKLAELASNIL